MYFGLVDEAGTGYDLERKKIHLTGKEMKYKRLFLLSSLQEGRKDAEREEERKRKMREKEET